MRAYLVNGKRAFTSIVTLMEALNLEDEPQVWENGETVTINGYEITAIEVNTDSGYKALHRIIGETNGYITNSGGATTVELLSGLTLESAKSELVDLFNRLYENEIGNSYIWKWEEIRKRFPTRTATYDDGTMCFEYDNRCYSIKPQPDEY